MAKDFKIYTLKDIIHRSARYRENVPMFLFTEWTVEGVLVASSGLTC